MDRFEEKNLESYLERRSSKILGGYITEQFFIDRFVTEKLDYTEGWWISKGRGNDKTFYFIVKNELSELDNIIINFLKREKNSIHQIKMIDNEIRIVDSDGEKSVHEFANKYKLQESRHVPKNIDDDLRRRCIYYYTETNKIGTIARSIYTEDAFLNKYFFSTNIDLFVKNPSTGSPVCIEIKFKDEFTKDKQLVFGEDKMQYEVMFPAMRNCGIDVYNCILYNHIGRTRNRQTSIFSYIDESNQIRLWMKKKFCDGEEHQKHTIRQTYTQFWGAAEREVYCIPLKEYSPMGEDLFSECNDAIWKICPVCGHRMIIRSNGRTGEEFWGCTNYKNHPGR